MKIIDLSAETKMVFGNAVQTFILMEKSILPTDESKFDLKLLINDYKTRLDIVDDNIKDNMFLSQESYDAVYAAADRFRELLVELYPMLAHHIVEYLDLIQKFKPDRKVE